ncbi:60S acidic ribosomal protein P0 [Monoraphidium neglectum]|uniref:60S acidic ribosomal protein P0 n=1 Tax=Monoraphidium neglectum TaxID=145388 RepID=A0A0D2N962_9CHLO|nr:60S acidic ribosomal protein P0 [Monoraphidium neglectum]KIZ02211.1 60S acidic ribosomal protein P0 [Monoraphidium neglectum]|eukprot:XP_013901230.1 60S acidic ribosomal protein P0 [Monoraphidium neglectum]
MPSATKLEKKEAYHARLCDYLDTYEKAFIVHADNVGSKQFSDIRAALRPESLILMGKNTMMKRSIRLYCEEKEDDRWAPLLDELVGNVGIIFTKADLASVKDEIAKYKVGAPARVGLVAPNDVTIPGGGTGMDPSQTSFFQALNIATKINKGTIDIVNDVHLIKAGDKVGASEAALLGKLGIKPFKYGLEILKVYENGSLFDAAVLSITDEALLGSAAAALANVAALSLAANYPTLASIPHSVVNGYKNVLAIAVETDYSFPLADKVKAYLADPSAFASAAPAASGEPAAAAPAKKEEPSEEEEEDMGFSLFD